MQSESISSDDETTDIVVHLNNSESAKENVSFLSNMRNMRESPRKRTFLAKRELLHRSRSPNYNSLDAPLLSSPAKTPPPNARRYSQLQQKPMSARSHKSFQRRASMNVASLTSTSGAIYRNNPLHLENIELREAIQRLKRENNKLLKSRADLKAEAILDSKKINHLKYKIEILWKIIKALSMNEELSIDLDQFRPFLDGSDEYNVINSVNQRLKNQKKQIQTLLNEIERLKKELSAVKQSKDSTDASYISRTMLSESIETIAALDGDQQTRESTVDERYESEVQKNEELKSELEQMQKSLDLWKQQMNEQSQTIQTLNEQNSAFSAMNESLESQLSECKESERAFSSKLEATRQQYTEVMDENKALKKELTESAQQSEKREYCTVAVQTPDLQLLQKCERLQLENEELFNEVASLICARSKFEKCGIVSAEEQEIQCMVASPKEPLIASAAKKSNICRLWRYNHSESELRPAMKAVVDGTILCLNMNKTGSMLAAGCALHSTPSGYIIIWDMAAFTVLCHLKSRSAVRFGKVHSVLFQKRLIFGGDTTGFILGWNLAQLSQSKKSSKRSVHRALLPVTIIKAHTDIIYDLSAINNDQIVSVSEDKTAQISKIHCSSDEDSQQQPTVMKQSVRLLNDEKYALKSLAVANNTTVVTGSRKIVAINVMNKDVSVMNVDKDLDMISLVRVIQTQFLVVLRKNSKYLKIINLSNHKVSVMYASDASASDNVIIQNFAIFENICVCACLSVSPQKNKRSFFKAIKLSLS